MKKTISLMTRVAICCFAASPLGTAQDSSGESADGKLPRVAFVAPPEGDPDYELMGEFVGVIAASPDHFEPLGLQLRTVGPGQFEALQFIGGLPGQEGYQSSKILPLIGRRFETLLLLSGGPWAIWVYPNYCEIFDARGGHTGRLDRIERGSPTMGARPPEGAIVLFDGTGTDQFVSARMTEDGLLMAGADALPMFQDFHLHLEFRLPYMPNSDDQARGNSGVYILSRYEVQILESFAQLPKFNGAAALYRTKAPDINMSFPPLVWQTYDITFTAPRWAADGTKIRNARITVWHNGVKVQDDVEIPNKTGSGREEEPTLLPLRFQNHRDPVVFRNIWVIDRGLTEGVSFPILAPAPEELKAEHDRREPAKNEEEDGEDNGDVDGEEDEEKESAEQIQESSSSGISKPNQDGSDPTGDISAQVGNGDGVSPGAPTPEDSPAEP